jgi:hypothetical protein
VTRIVIKIMVEVISGHSLIKGARKDRASKLVVYAAMKTTIAIFYLGGGTTVFKSGSINHVSRPVAVS